jgi:hypothetical protein
MTAHDWYVENRGSFVARSLDPREERTFRDHLVRCDECAREVERLTRELAWLPMAVAPVSTGPGWTRRVATHVLDRPNRWRRALPYAVAAAALLVAGGAMLVARQERRGAETLLATSQRRLAALQDTVSVLRRANQVLQANISMGGHSGGLLIFQDAVSHRWAVIVHGLPPAPPGNVYQFWFITETGMVRSVEVHADQTKPAYMTLPMPGVAAPVMGAALTMEPAVNRSTSEPKGVMLAHLVF